MRQFEDWLVAETWDVHQSGDADAVALATQVDLLLAEWSGGHLAEGDLRVALIRLLEGQWATFAVVTSWTTLRFSGAGTQLAGVSG